MSSMRPSAVRERILREHASIRLKLNELERAAERLETEGTSAIPAAAELSRALYDELRDHIDMEDAILAPALRETDAWGEVRASKLEAHHRDQRVELKDLGEVDVDSITPETFAKRLRDFVAEVRADMVHEETGVLSPELLKDDVIGVDVEGG
jgi:iron-sulfur cluster repair protein YtfE (RIC family)